MKITSFIKIAATTGAALTLSAMAAFAVEATATVELNVRTGPGTNFGVIDTLNYGERVNTTECVSSGWCYIEQAQQNGWVSSSYLRAVPPPSATPPGAPGAPDCQLRLTLGGGSPQLEIVCNPGAVPAPPPPPPPPVGAQACFYQGANYQGASFCYAPGSLNSLNAQFNDRISSVRITGSVVARICANNNLNGECVNIARNTPVLAALINNRSSSIKVFRPGVIAPPPPPPPAVPAILRSGALSIASSFAADFDTGTISGAGSDVWHHAINAAVRRLEVRNGAKIALGDGSRRGYAGCSSAAYSSNPVPFAQLGVNTYVCVKTNRGRIAQFRVMGYTGTTMNIRYTVWVN